MGIADLKKQARALEQSGDAAAALTIYDEILSELERMALEPDGALYVKVGDLSLKTGQRARAIALFERAAEEYAREGAYKAVTALCLKILRTNPRRKDTHIRYAKRLFTHGHLEATRQVLLDYAERSRLEKTLQTLGALPDQSPSEQRAKLEKFFEVADRAVRQSGERPAIPELGPAERPSGPTLPPAAVTEPAPVNLAAASTVESADEQRVWATGSDGAQREPVALEPVEPIPSALAAVGSSAIEPDRPVDPVVEAIIAGPPAETDAVEREPEPSFAAEHVPEPALSVVRGARPAKPQPRPSSLATIVTTLKSRRLWPWPAAAAAVLVLGVALMGFGAIPFGGDLDADEPAPTPLVSVATASVLGTTTADSTMSADSTMPSDPTGPIGVHAETGVNDPSAPVATVVAEESPGALAALDRDALSAASHAAVTVDLGAVDDVLESELADVGRIAVPTSLTAPTAMAENADPSAERSAADRMVVAIEGLPIVGMTSSTDEYTLVQRLESGESITLTVLPFANAPAGETGRLSVRPAAGDSAMGSRRYGDAWVTVRGTVTPATLRDLLGRLRERSWR